jgi:hypothetical protein
MVVFSARSASRATLVATSARLYPAGGVIPVNVREGSEVPDQYPLNPISFFSVAIDVSKLNRDTTGMPADVLTPSARPSAKPTSTISDTGADIKNAIWLAVSVDILSSIPAWRRAKLADCNPVVAPRNFDFSQALHDAVRRALARGPGAGAVGLRNDAANDCAAPVSTLGMKWL